MNCRFGVGMTVALAMCAALAPVTQAQTRVSPWHKISEPTLSQRQFIQQFADHKREPRDLEHETDALRINLHKAAAMWLETILGAKLETLEEPELLFLYGECLAYAGPAYLARAQAILERALRLAPQHPAVASVWNTLGRVQVARGESAAAYAAFEQALALEWDADTRTGILIEQGLARMGTGELDLAIERLSAARDATDQSVLWSLAQWALGVAIDRALLGPEGAALAWTASQGRFGANGELDVLALPGIAPEPESETTYYRALALMGKAQALEPRHKVAALLEAKFVWLDYLRKVGPLGPFITRARYHMAQIDQLTDPPDADKDLDRQARTPFDPGTADAGSLAADHMIWPEEHTQGEAFWGGDAGAPAPPADD